MNPFLQGVLTVDGLLFAFCAGIWIAEHLFC